MRLAKTSWKLSHNGDNQEKGWQGRAWEEWRNYIAAIFKENGLMKTFSFIAAGVLAVVVSACSREPDCTSEMLAEKTQELTTALREALEKDPSRAADLTRKVQDITTRYQRATTLQDACKAYDDLIESMGN
ncbi:hypothetical protein [Pseudaminobacter salicylatoxidans]|nr:hypothetical protein [Pseudaminobacter salicylatoxidans]